MSFEITKINDFHLEEMAKDWVDNLIFSDRHIVPRNQELIYAVFPGVKILMDTNSKAKNEILENSGLFWMFMSEKRFGQTISVRENGRLLPIFDDVRFVHKDQIEALQKLIAARRLYKKFGGGMTVAGLN